MDDLDRDILDLLLKNGRMSHEQIGKAIHLSRPAVFERIKRLEAKKVIKGYAARIDWEATGLPLTAFVLIRLQAVNCNETGREIAKVAMEGAVLEELCRVTGDWCMLAKLRVAAPSVLQEMIDRIRLVPGVQNTNTMLALSWFEET
ncbi:MAG TPA: Lrp/AsnC family transcriptional regulator [Holophaga sp.]|nr:Lrp/AsnC family transcriptional regulator [Holophaga sp.]